MPPLTPAEQLIEADKRSINVLVPSMDQGFTLSTSAGAVTVPADWAPAFQHLLTSLLRERIYNVCVRL